MTTSQKDRVEELDSLRKLFDEKRLWHICQKDSHLSALKFADAFRSHIFEISYEDTVEEIDRRLVALKEAPSDER